MNTVALLLAGFAAGVLVGAVLRRADLCFHSMFRNAWRGDVDLLSSWLLAVAVGSVGLSVVFATSIGDDLNRGLPLDPVRNVTGGLLIGAGMVVARSCTSGLFYKLGLGMVGALLGVAGWAAGELLARDIDPPGGVVLAAGDGATIPGVLHVPRWLLAVVVAAVGLWLRRGGVGARGMERCLVRAEHGGSCVVSR